MAEDKKKTLPPALDVAKDTTPAPQAAVAQSLNSAKFISEPVSYPEGVQSPNPALNVTIVAGKFRYDREFLLQFMEICKEKPESLPVLSDIGLEADTGSQRRGNSSRGPGSRSGPTASFPPRGAASGFSMGMGSFSSGPIPKSSADRFAASQPSAGGFSRTPMSRQSSTGPGQFSGGAPSSPSMKGGRVRSERGKNRNDIPSFPSAPLISAVPEAPVAPLVESANRWIPGSAKKGTDENSPELVDRKVKALLNKLTMENFDSISTQIMTWANKSKDETDGRTLRQVIRLVFEKATDEAHWSEMYARLCRKMMEQLSPEIADEQVLDPKGGSVTGGTLFRKYLLNRCQEDFERGWAARESTSAAAASKAVDDKAIKDANDQADAAATEAGEEKPKEEAALMSDEYYTAQKAKRQGLGLIRLIGELFKLEMLTERIMHVCIKQLLTNVATPEEEDIESLCRLISTVGKQLDTAKAKGTIDVYFNRMQHIIDNPSITSRMQFMLLVSCFRFCIRSFVCFLLLILSCFVGLL